MKVKIILLFTSLLSFATISVFAHNTEKQEPLYGASIFKHNIEIIVKSNGCTKAQDFRLEELNGGDHTLLNIVRIKPDRCRAMSRPKTIQLALKVKQQSVYYKINNSFMSSKALRKQQNLGGEK